jgi:hypothetical protein
MPAEVKLSPNIPLTLALADPSGIPEDFRVHFETSDGRVLTLPREAAIRLNVLDLRPGEKFSLCKDWDGETGHPSTIRIWLPASTEQDRAAETEAEVEQITAQTRRSDPPRRTRHPKMEPDPPPRGNGTYGPALARVAIPESAPAPVRSDSRIPMNLAFREVVQFVTAELKQSGEQWSDQSRQDLVSTVIIAAQKQGLLKVWER